MVCRACWGGALSDWRPIRGTDCLRCPWCGTAVNANTAALACHVDTEEHRQAVAAASEDLAASTDGGMQP